MFLLITSVTWVDLRVFTSALFQLLVTVVTGLEKSVKLYEIH